MSDHPIEGLMNVTMQKIKEMVDVNTIIGEPISTADGTTIIPISKVSYGFASGGSDIPSKNAPNREIFGGGSGAGVSINPIAFLAVHEGKVELLNIEHYDGTADRVVSLVPELIDKISGLFKKDKDGKNEEKEAEIKLDDPAV